MKRVYIAGAYSAPDMVTGFDNMRRGMQLGYQVLKAGFAPFVPWFDYHFSLVGAMSLEEYYAYSMAWLEVSDAVLPVLVGLDRSKGAQTEIARARQLAIPVFQTLLELVAWDKGKPLEMPA